MCHLMLVIDNIACWNDRVLSPVPVLTTLVSISKYLFCFSQCSLLLVPSGQCFDIMVYMI